MKVAKLVYVSLVTRVIVEDTADEAEILDIAKSRFIDKIETELDEHLESIIDDTEVPYDESFDWNPYDESFDLRLDKNEISKMYEVDVTRLGIGTKTLKVAAFNPEDAKKIALNIAGNYLYTEKDAEYKIDDIRIENQN